ncbi:MAG: pyridoxamine 5'-phosphate oxidase family protein, partial [Methylotenera sp.]
MKTETQTNPALIQLCKIIEDMTIGMITSVDASGALVSRPMAPLEMDSNGTIWLFTDISSGKVGHLNPANLSFTNESR